MGLSNPSQSKYLDVICVGTALMDHLAFVEKEVLDVLGLTLGTMTLIESDEAGKIAGSIGDCVQVSGGTVANTAVGLASFGGRAAFVGAVGTESLGERYGSDLEEAGVRAILERLSSTESFQGGTGRCFVLVTPDAERTMATMLGAGPLLDHDAIHVELLASTQFVYFDGYVLDFPDANRLVSRIVDVARNAGTSIALGLADPLVVQRHHAALSALAEQDVDLLFANATEAMALTGANDVEGAVSALRRPGLTSVITCGSNGAVLAGEHEVTAIPADPVAEVIDASGAGDLFAAGVLFGITHGYDLATAGQFGALAAAEVIGHLGARPQTSLAARALPLITSIRHHRA
jgi:sugar/nucleoside kinase (ribokinase family)